MTLRTFEGTAPVVDDSAYVDPRAVVIGDVRIEAEANVWPGATLRGDLGSIVIREGSAIQDNAVCHADAGDETVVGPDATVAHCAVVHGAIIGRQSLVGINAVVLDGASVADRTVIAAGSVVREGASIPSNVLVAGVPATVKTSLDGSRWFEAGAEYVELAARHRQSSTRLEGDPSPEP